EWSQDSQHFAFTNTTANGIELWIGQIGTYTANAVPKIRLSAVMGEPLQWMPDGKTLLVQTVPVTRGNPPAAPKTPDGPIIQESDGKRGPLRTFEDLLQNQHDEDLFDYYATTQLALVKNGVATPVASRGSLRAWSPHPTASICWSAAFNILIRTSCRKANSRAKWKYGALPASWNTKLPACHSKSMFRLKVFHLARAITNGCLPRLPRWSGRTHSTAAILKLKPRSAMS
ncbi:MAG TPA: hypothetical protein VGK01_01750, partial [Candidatus Angelobacter sp.]